LERRVRRFRFAGYAVGAVFALTLGATLVPRTSFATTVDVTGGGLDAGGLCAIGAICPSNPIDGYTYSSGGAVSGSLDFNSSTDTADFTFTLTTNTYFGGEELAAGSTFAATGISVTVTPGTHGTETISLATPSTDASATNVNFVSPALGVTANAPLLSALTCSLTSTGGQCGVSLGSVNGAANSLLLSDGSNNDYNAYLTFNVNVAPVPIPAALPLLLSGVAGFAAWARRRRPAAPANFNAAGGLTHHPLS
jgi:hypothetical protein